MNCKRVILVLFLLVGLFQANAQNPCPNNTASCVDCGLSLADFYVMNFTTAAPIQTEFIYGVQSHPCCTPVEGDHQNNNAGCSIIELNFGPGILGFRINAAGAGANSGDVRVIEGMGGGLPASFCGIGYTVLQDFINNGGFCVGDPTEPYYLMICKPGTNDYTLEIEAITAESFGDFITIADNPSTCASQVNVTTTATLDNITWTSINGSLAYLDCGGGPLDCLDPTFTPPGNLGSPTTFTYQVCGEYVDPQCGNLGVIVCDTVYIQVIPLVEVVIEDIINCDYNYPYTINASVNPAYPTFEYHWYDDLGGPTGGGTLLAITNSPSYSINQEGDYSLYIIDTDNSYTCPISITHDFTITDLPQAPAIIIPPSVICSDTDLTFEADNVLASSPGNYDVTYTWTFPNSNEGFAFGPGPHDITYDACGEKTAILEVQIQSLIDNSVTCLYSDTEIIPTDLEDPVFTFVPADISASCVTIPPWDPNDATATDNCSIVALDTSSTITPGVCSGEYTITRTWIATDNCLNTAEAIQIITVTDNVDPVVDPLTGGTFDCVASVPAPDVNIVVAQDQGCGDVTVTWAGDVGSNVCGGSLIRTYEVEDDCGNITPVTQTFTLNDNLPPTMNCPGDITMECVGEVPALPTTYAEFVAAGGMANDNCGIVENTFTFSESIVGTCPTVITRTFSIEDSCGAVANCQWVITIIPPSFVWVNPPANITIDCGQADDFVAGDATYTNAEPGICEITGTVPGVVSSNYTECGGSITVDYQYVGQCETINYTQTITVTRAPVATWISEEPDFTVTCENALTFVAQDIDYTNGDDGNCLISGTVSPSNVNPQFDNCGGTITVDWTFTDNCNNTITSQQIITVSPAPLPTWLNPPGNVTISCNDAVSFTAPDLDYSNAANGNCLITGTTSPSINPSFDDCGGTITVTWSDVDECGRPLADHVQTVTVQPADQANWVNPPPAIISLDCGSAVSYDAGPISYTNGNNGTCLISGQVDPINVDSNFTECGGTITIDWEFTDNCLRTITYQQVVTVLPAAIANWISPPGPVTLTCNAADAFAASDLGYTNSSPGTCLITGLAPPAETRNYTDCAGGTITVDWTFTDACNNTIDHQQIITVDAAPPATWVNAPADITITCEEGLTYVAPQLAYTNSGNGACLIDGLADPMVTPNYDNCGGTIIIDWHFEDDCLRPLDHQQTITVLPAPAPTWVSPPAAITITCDQARTYVFPNLDYNNGAGSTCDISGTIPAVVTPNFTECGGTITGVWSFLDPCGRPLDWTQVITVSPAPQATWTNNPGAITITCEEALTFIPLTLNYSNGVVNECDISGSVDPVSINPVFTECGGTITVDWLFTDACNRDLIWQQIVTVSPAPQATFTSLPGDVTITCDEGAAFTAPNLDYSNGGTTTCDISGFVPPVIVNNFNECGGSISVTWTFVDACLRQITHTQNITIDPAPLTNWITPPGPITITCDEAIQYVPVPLGYSNAGAGTCLIEGQVLPTRDSSYTECGGTLTFTWDFVDSCNRSIQHVQIITVDPAPIADWVSPPADITISCNEADTLSYPQLQYTNGGLSGCLIEGFSDPQVVPVFDECGGTITITWQFLDDCNRPIEWIQNIIVDPAPIADWINPPGDTTITCDAAIVHVAPQLDYANTGIGVCVIQGSIVPTVTNNFDLCGGTITIDWTFTDDCNRLIDHQQIITVSPTPEPVWQNAPDAITITCNEALTHIPPTLTYSNAANGSCLISGSINPVVVSDYTECGGTITVTWDYLDPCARPLTHQQIITVTRAPEPVWSDAPGPITITCNEALTFVPIDLNYTNGDQAVCLISGSVSASNITPDFTECGGTITVDWIFTDNCGIPLTHQQIVTVEPAAIANWVAPPADITLTCSEADAFVPDPIEYSNAELQTCTISGFADPVETRTYNECGGQFSIYWTFTDNCDRQIEHTQIITVSPAEPVVWINPPANTIISCSDATSFVADPLQYSNQEAGSCIIEGEAQPVTTENFTECGGTITINWEFADSCNRQITHQQIITVEPAPEAIWVNPPADITITCNEADTLTPRFLGYSNGDPDVCLVEGNIFPIEESSFNECGGTIRYTWNFTDNCNRSISHVQDITVEPAPEPIWIDAPADITLSCAEALEFIPPNLDYSNSNQGVCIIEGSINPLVTNDFTQCGGTITLFWTFTDNCNRTIDHTQIISVEPSLAPEWLLPPGDITITCAEALTYNPPLVTISNNDNGSCLISEGIDPTATPDFDDCGGLITVVWNYEDPCGRLFSHTQIVTVRPAPAPEWVSPPDEITIECSEADDYVIPDLSYTNFRDGVCLISGSVAGTKENDYTECGGEINITWQFIDNCNRTITHTQLVYVSPSPVATFSQVPDDLTMSCAEAVDFVPDVLDYSNAGSGSCLIEGSVQGDVDNRYDLCGGEIEITWRFKDDCDRIIEHIQLISVEPTEPAQFLDVPENLTITCEEADQYEAIRLEYSNGDANCLIEGNLSPFSVVNEYNQCGGAIFIYYFFQDDCGRSIDHNLEVTVLPAAVPTFINPPLDTTLSCELFEDFEILDLNFTNTETGSCIIEGSVPGALTEVDDDECNPHYQIRWSFRDECGLTIEHIQNIFLQDTTPPTITGTPSDVTVDCNNIPEPPRIFNTITADDNCRLPSLTFNEDQLPGPCENIYLLLRTWTADDECGNTTQTSQEITVHCPPDLFISIQPNNIVCEGEQVLFSSNLNPAYSNPVYQWQFSTNTTDWSDISDAILDEYLIDSTHSAVAGYYRLVAADDINNLSELDCRVISDPIRLQVIPTLFTNLNHTICRGEQIIVGTKVFNESGVYREVLVAASGCDSIVNLILTVNDHSAESVRRHICEGDNVVVGSEIFSVNGIYTIVLPNAKGCDSTVTLDLRVHIPFNETRIETICAGESIEINSEIFNTTGNYLVSMKGQFGCDSLVSLQLTVIEPKITDLDITMCDGQTYTVGSETFDSTGIYIINLKAASGCDSIVNLDLTETTVIETEINRSICIGETYTLGSNTYDESGTYSATFASIAGCDSTVTLNLQVVSEITNDLTVEICEGDSYEVNGENYFESGIRFISLVSSGGCDSLIVFTLNVNENYENTREESICEGEFVEVNGVPYNSSGTYDINMLSSKGCDSIIHLILDVNENYSSSTTEVFCFGGSVQVGTNTYDQTGIYVDSFTTTSGCDSVIITNLTIHPIYDTTLVVTICEGDSYGVGALSYSSTGVYPHQLSTQAGCDSLVTLDLTVVNELTSELDVQICEGLSYTFGSQTLSDAGTYSESFTSSLGCDSIATIHLTTVPQLTSSFSDIICEGEAYDFYGSSYSIEGSYSHSLVSTQGCDSIVTLNLLVALSKENEIVASICEGESYEFNNVEYSESGSYETLFSTSFGCDSLVTLILTANEVYLDTIEANICEGESYQFDNQSLTTTGYFTQNTQSIYGCDSNTVLNLIVKEIRSEEINAQICIGSFYRFGGEQKTASGQYTTTLISSLGCDSILTLNLEVVNELTEMVFAQICEGGSYEFNGETYSSSGSFPSTLTSSLGCDSIVTLELSVVNEVTTQLDIEICEGQNYTFDNESFTETGEYVKSFISSIGCDSIVTLNLVVNAVYKDTLEEIICEGEAFTFNGDDYFTSGTYQADLTSIDNCDSTIVLLLQVVPTVISNISAQICFDETFELGSQSLNQSGQYSETFTSSVGCDSVVNLELIVIDQIVEEKSIQICLGSTYEFNGVTYDTPTSQTATFVSSAGCDSTVTIQLSVVEQVETFAVINLCPGETTLFKGGPIDSAGIYADTLVSNSGCDSISTIEVILHSQFADTIEAQICGGEIYSYQGQELTEAGDYDFDFITVSGCDSIVTIRLEVLFTPESSFSIQICNGEMYDFNGTSLNESGSYQQTFNTTSGCDSLVTLNLDVLEPISNAINQQICEGGSAEFNAISYSESTQQTATFTSVLGCDSLVSYTLEVLTELTTSLDGSICEGGTYTFNDSMIVDPGTYTATYGSSLGCDSIVTLTLVVVDKVENTIDAFICEGETYTVDNQEFANTGSYEIILVSSTGCDSIVTLNLEVGDVINQVIDVTICTGDTYEFNGETISESSTQTASYQSAAGCDSMVTLNLSIVDKIVQNESYSICPGEVVLISDVEYSEAIEFSESYFSVAGCDSIVNYSVTVLPGVELIVEDYKICEGDNVQLMVGGAENRTVTWSPTANLSCTDCLSPTANPSQTTTYTVSVEGCSGNITTANITVEVLPMPTITAPEDMTVSSGSTITISVSQENASEIAWYKNKSELICNSCESIVESPTMTTEYTIIASNELGCAQEDDLVIFVEDDCDLGNIEIVNAMTPNNDGVNDLFEIRNNGLAEVLLVQVFSRWGETVFESNSMDDKWDGSFRNKKLAPAVFTYMVKVRCIGGNETAILKGNVTIIK